jgi:CubicO group peptidase (beta-lactamase class C family)
MRTLLRILLGHLLALLAAGPVSAQSDPGAELQGLLSAYADYRAFEGAILVSHEGRTVYEGAFGLADHEWGIPNEPETRFLIASVTKPVTAALVMKLVESGALSLDEPVTRYLPLYRRDTGEGITVHHLLSHSSGIPNYAVWRGFWDGNPSRMKYERDEFIDRFCSGDLLFPPGSQGAYSDANYYLLAAIVEEVTGLSWPQALAQGVLQPLGMKSSGVVLESELIPRRARGYFSTNGEISVPPYIDYEHTQLGAGDMYSTVGDLLLFTQGLLGDEFLGTESRDRMFREYVTSGFPDAQNGYGWNLARQSLRDSGRILEVAHAPGNNAGFTTLIYLVPRSNTAIIIAENVGRSSLDMKVYEMAREVVQLLYGESYVVPRPSIVAALAPLLEEGNIPAADSTYRAMRDLGEFDLDTRGMNRLGYQLLSRGRVEAAVAVFEWNVESDPSWGNAYDSLGEALLLLGERERAIDNYRKALELEPENENAKRVLSTIERERP